MATAQPVGPYSSWRRAGDWLVVSGQLGLLEGELVAPETVLQASQALHNLENVLHSAGSSLAEVVKTTIFLVDIDDYEDVNHVYMAAFTDNRPARSAVAVSALPLGARFEIEAWAYSPRGATQ